VSLETEGGIGPTRFGGAADVCDDISIRIVKALVTAHTH
jgi:hypothetical protein